MPQAQICGKQVQMVFEPYRDLDKIRRICYMKRTEYRLPVYLAVITIKYKNMVYFLKRISGTGANDIYNKNAKNQLETRALLEI